MTELTTELKTKLNKSIKTLTGDISRVEKELDLELDNLGDLLDQRHPDVANQLKSLNESIARLHRSLGEVRGYLGDAATETAELHDSVEHAKDQLEQEAASRSADDDEGLSASEAESERHSSEVTLGSILRSLLMAEEPAQRHNDDFSGTSRE